MFQVVGQPSLEAGCSKERFISDMVEVVQRVCEHDMEEGMVEVSERMGGKFISLKMTCMVRAPEIIGKVFDALEGDARVRMKF